MSFPKVPPIIQNANEMARRLAITANQTVSGKMNVTNAVTLTANAATTTISLSAGQLGNDTKIHLVPTTANAAAEIGNGTLYVSAKNVTNNTITITHANNAQTDRIFDYVIVG